MEHLRISITTQGPILMKLCYRGTSISLQTIFFITTVTVKAIPSSEMQCGKLIFVALVVAMLMAVAFVPEAEAHHHHHRRGQGLSALLTAGIIAKVLEHQHHGCHHHHG
ncbi:hypothetical protein AVEN_59691-1 [Araneus ventricosus]|uniref:Uncharacterized protein n=1 Tax=Araneus ventricosus TaxID=182803 RepID=A0A4Y2BQM8_ARAVE|nr:hypothetical protein AVEN_59691-1 [Araneus ventricosus]